jgi:hypothetical protein
MSAPIQWTEAHGIYYTDTHAVSERPEGGWVVSVRPIESPIFASADEAKRFVENGVAQLEAFYIDCEFDGHNGQLLSIAMVRGDGRSLHVKVENAIVVDPWVQENVLPIMDAHHADLSWTVRPNEVGTPLRGFIGDCQNPTIIADSPVDIARFCRAISTGEDGGWHSTDYAGMTFVVHNVNCYPTALEGAVQHNAWWDAMALRAKAHDAWLASRNAA